jgi:DNA-binding MarR family transcriptional regulator
LSLEPRPEKRSISEVLDRQKLAILNFLRDHPDASSSEISEEMGLSEYTTVNSLRVLTAVQLVTKQRGPAHRRGVPPYLYRATAHGEDLAGRLPAEATA